MKLLSIKLDKTSASLAMFLAFAVMLVPELGLATNAIGQGICRAVELITSDAGKAIATLAVITLGIGALLGKVSWGMAIMVAVGIVVIFAATDIVNQVSGNAAGADCNATGG